MSACNPQLAQLRGVINDDAYSLTFQSFGQYCNALLQRIDSMQAKKPSMEKPMQLTPDLPLVASMYPDEHPFPVAVRQLSALQRLVFSGVVVQFTDLQRYTTSPYGGMRPDPQGPWVTLLDVMGRSRTTHNDDIAVARFTSKMHSRMELARKGGASGWDRPSLCAPETLALALLANLGNGDFVSVANYAMMLEERGVDPVVGKRALDHYCDMDSRTQRVRPIWIGVDLATPEPAPEARETAEAFAQALIAKGWHNDDVDCVDGVQELLAQLLASHANTVTP